jgi:hypothetical protein
MKILSLYKLIIIGAILGGLGGYAYYYFVGCASGTCAITSRPLNSTLYGAFMGGLLFDIFRKRKDNPSGDNQNSN